MQPFELTAAFAHHLRNLAIRRKTRIFAIALNFRRKIGWVLAENVFAPRRTKHSYGRRIAVDHARGAEDHHRIGRRFKQGAVTDFRLLQFRSSFLDSSFQRGIGILEGGVGALPAPTETDRQPQPQQAGHEQDAGGEQCHLSHFRRDFSQQTVLAPKQKQMPAVFQSHVEAKPPLRGVIDAADHIDLVHIHGCRAGAGTDVLEREVRAQGFSKWLSQPGRIALGDSSSLPIHQHGVIERSDRRWR